MVFYGTAVAAAICLTALIGAIFVAILAPETRSRSVAALVLAPLTSFALYGVVAAAAELGFFK